MKISDYPDILKTDCNFPAEYDYMEVKVIFTNDSYRLKTPIEDKTEFIIHAWDFCELENLYNTFCMEKHISNDTVTEIIITSAAKSYDELCA